MQPINLAGFAGLCLEHCERNCLRFTPYILQKYIRNHPDSGAAIKIDEIQSTLDLLVDTGWLELVDSNLETYQRYIPCRNRRIKE